MSSKRYTEEFKGGQAGDRPQPLGRRGGRSVSFPTARGPTVSASGMRGHTQAPLTGYV